uniref:Uncharacterized protein n=1 Tax=Chromera velia CCMP2878 TaxID=1169474 RepID=A0A0G4HE71_9ALVE|mmetsp:Transcript_11176/g.21633  ORF Transcript_11176/g.21633 Transcript_11176/m.21633 type:complete len:422 (-) Transcript_11176:25-1290(-)|eukprot:Cvel_26532.t1-p1 / transcript=Cvel_26532.t1 / gene=Cvel_26532 / organism=Chromera_velia_CCMP2878 / gene_product=hypothetical protein / transcript_product=hypothetical protein / location=Cvel_scaffold3172:1675-4517(-) / protein_length=421 / sequence_SO=supercontig / SO=protein_coding / is_pseudo=false
MTLMAVRTALPEVALASTTALVTGTRALPRRQCVSESPSPRPSPSPSLPSPSFSRTPVELYEERIDQIHTLLKQPVQETLLALQRGLALQRRKGRFRVPVVSLKELALMVARRCGELDTQDLRLLCRILSRNRRDPGQATGFHGDKEAAVASLLRTLAAALRPQMSPLGSSWKWKLLLREQPEGRKSVERPRHDTSRPSDSEDPGLRASGFSPPHSFYSPSLLLSSLLCLLEEEPDLMEEGREVLAWTEKSGGALSVGSALREIEETDAELLSTLGAFAVVLADAHPEIVRENAEARGDGGSLMETPCSSSRETDNPFPSREAAWNSQAGVSGGLSDSGTLTRTLKVEKRNEYRHERRRWQLCAVLLRISQSAALSSWRPLSRVVRRNAMRKVCRFDDKIQEVLSSTCRKQDQTVTLGQTM